MTETTPRTGRNVGLDGLRGIAALVVLVHHVLLSSPSLADAYRGHPDLPTAQKVLTYTPVHLFWAGTEAVLVFFVLSGFVLTVGFLGERRPTWFDYYPRRVLRLYLPTLAALLVAFPQAHWLRPTSPDDKAGWVYNAHEGTGTVHNLLRDATLGHQKATFLDGPLWSLHWEVVFSLLLPLYLLLVMVKNRWASVGAMVLLLAVTALGVHRGNDNLVFLPIFGLGVLAASHQADLRLLAARWSRWLVAAGCLLLTAQWTVTGVHDLSLNQVAVTTALTAFGATLVLVGFLDGTVGRWSSGSAVVRWLGKRSFSLYLTHAPIIISVAYLLGGHPSVWVLLLACIPLSLLAAEVFGLLVEEPAHQLSKRVGAFVDQRVKRTRAVA